MNLTSKQQQWLGAYKITGDGTKAAIEAGYAPKTAPTVAYKLLKNPKIIAELAKWKEQKRITKDDFVDMALNDYRSLEVEHNNKPRFLDIAGKALGYIGAQDKQQQVVNQTLNINAVGSLPLDQLRELIRRQIQAE